MTDKPTPTDAELKALLLDKLPASKHYIRPVIEKMVAAMQAAIDKWGQPAVAAEPVAVVVPCYTPSGKRVALCSAKQDLPIGTKLYAAPQPSPTTHPADSVQEDACHAPPCDSELFESGVSVGLFDMPKWTAEALCKGIAAATGARVDWHYIGGRVHVKALPAPTSAEGAAYAELPDLSDAVNLARNALTQYDCAITKKGVRVLAEAVLSMDSALTTPQPTHAQAGAEPLTDKQIQDLLLCGDPTDEEMRLIRIGWDALLTASKEASMALSRDCRHGRQIGKCADCDLDHMEMAADAEARRVDELTALRKQDTELIQQLVLALESVDGAMPFPVARQVLKVARARLGGKP